MQRASRSGPRHVPRPAPARRTPSGRPAPFRALRSRVDERRPRRPGAPRPPATARCRRSFPPPRRAAPPGPAPSSAGARYASTRSTRCAATNAPASRGPPSSSTSTTPRACSAASTASGSWVRRCSTSGASRANPRRDVAVPDHHPQRAALAQGAVGVAGGQRRDRRRARCRCPRRSRPLSARSACTSARASAPVIQRLVPSAAALRPSRVAASFQVTCGRPVRTACSHARSGPRRDLVGQHALADGDTGGAQHRGAAARGRVRVAHREDDRRHAGGGAAPRCTAGCGRGARTARG